MDSKNSDQDADGVQITRHGEDILQSNISKAFSPNVSEGTAEPNIEEWIETCNHPLSKYYGPESSEAIGSVSSDDEDMILIPKEGSDTHYRPSVYRTYRPIMQRRREVCPPSNKPKVAKRSGKTFMCKCGNQSLFEDAASLQKHIESDHPRPFVCIFNFAGCDTRFVSKNEWRSHVSGQHFKFSTWFCKLQSCSKVRNGAEFDRRDLFVQHVRRVHSRYLEEYRKKRRLELKEGLNEFITSCLRVNRRAPAKLACPVIGCAYATWGRICFYEYMEHIGKHLEESPVNIVQGSIEIDHSSNEPLVDWALRERIIGGFSGRYYIHDGTKPPAASHDEVLEKKEMKEEDEERLYNIEAAHAAISSSETLLRPQLYVVGDNTQRRLERGDRESAEKGQKESIAFDMDDCKTESGYHTGRGTDTASITSCDSIEPPSGLSSDKLQDLIKTFINTLSESPCVIDWIGATTITTPRRDLESKFMRLLKKFSLELLPIANVDQDSKMMTDVCIFLRQNRKEIARCFTTSADPASTVGIFSQLKSSNIELTLDEKMNTWEQCPNRAEFDSASNYHASDDEENESLTEFAKTKDFLISSQPFQKLLRRLQTLYYDENEKLLAIRKIMERNPALSPLDYGYSKATFEMHWDILKFMRTQYETARNVRLASVITISGSALYCQATTAAEYLSQNWPVHGNHMLEVLQAALDRPELSAEASEGQKSRIAVDLNGTNVVEITGPEEYVLAMTQSLAWIGAAFRTSNTKEIKYSEAIITPHFKEAYSMRFLQWSLVDAERTCWLPLFYNPVIAKGFPIMYRPNYKLGIEIPLEMAAALVDAEQAVEYNGGLVIKGASSMLIPVKRRKDSVQWHLISNADGKRMKYSDVKARCPNRLSLDEFDHADLLKTRVFLAWWKVSESYAGTRQIRYNDITRTKARMVSNSKKPKITDISFGFQNWGMLSLNLAIGQKDRQPYVSRAGRLEVLLDAAEEMHVYLYDFACMRAWLISGTELLLYLVHLKHRKKPYVIQGKEAALLFAEPEGDGPAACRKALMNMASEPLFSDAAVSSEDFCVKDLIQQLWKRLESIEGKDEETGITVDLKFGQRLKGYEIMDLVLDKGLLRQRETILKDTNGGWPDLVKPSDGVVLFGNNLGELIKPRSDTNKLCSTWSSLPESKDYLATTTRKLLQILGEADEKGHVSFDGLSIHKATLLFEDCPSYLTEQCRCERLQQIIHKSFLSFKSITPLKPWGELGCIIIGRALNVLKSPKGSPSTSMYCLPNSQMLQYVDSEPTPQSPKDSEGEDIRTVFSATTPALVLTPSTSVSHDPSQDEETISTLSSALKIEASDLNISWHRRKPLPPLPTLPQIADMQRDLSQPLAKPPRKLRRQESKFVGGFLRFEAGLPEPRASCDPLCLGPDPMNNATIVDTQSSSNSHGNVPSDKSLGKRKERYYEK